MSAFECWVPLLSLVDSEHQPIPELIAAHLAWLKQTPVDGILVMGTTGEFPSFSMAERQRYLEVVLAHNPGFPVMVNVGAAAISDVLALQAHALAQPGVSSVLWMPPFYYPDTAMNGLADMLAWVLDQQPAHVPFLLYHHPKYSQVGITSELLSQFPQVAGMKDTSGDFERMGQLKKQFPKQKLYAGTDSELLLAKQSACDGVISALGNVAPGLLYAVASGRSEKIDVLRSFSTSLKRFCKIPALKAVLNGLQLSEYQAQCLPPFRDLTVAEVSALAEDCPALLSGVLWP